MPEFATNIFGADPSVHVFNGRAYAYVSYDEPYTNTYDSMVCYHALSSDDLVHWVDHGRILHLSQVEWAVSHMWAIDANYWKGKYYLTFCAIEKTTSTFRTGLAVSDRPEGPFTDLGWIKGAEWGQDPAFYVEGDGDSDDSRAYLLWGGRGAITIAEFNDDLLSVKPETVTNLSEQLNGYEGPFLHKKDDTYYLTYPALDGEEWPQRMSWATSKNLFGPYSYGGIYIDVYPGNSGTIHGSVVQFKDQWYAFYHSGLVSGTETSRSLMVDELHYNPDGSIQPITPRLAHVPAGNTVVILDAAVAEKSGGKLHMTRVEVDDSDYTGAGYVTGLTQQEWGLSFLAQVGKPRRYSVMVRYRSHADHYGRVMAAKHLFFDGKQNQTYEDYINRGTLFESTQGQWREIEIGQLDFASGDHEVRISNSHNLPAGQRGFDVDYLKLVPLN
ncbi:MAG: family 43 glycosylhydrolase [Micrococcales bacterium]